MPRLRSRRFNHDGLSAILGTHHNQGPFPLFGVSRSSGAGASIMWLYIPDNATAGVTIATPLGNYAAAAGEWIYTGKVFGPITIANPLPVAPANVSGAASPYLIQFPFDVSLYAELVGWFLGLLLLAYGAGALHRLFVGRNF